MGLIWSVFTLVQNAAFDFVVYILVDVVAKTPLREAGNDAEKRLIWFYESMVLFFTSILVYIFVHPPYVLVLLGILTFLYTQLQGRINFRYWWQQLTTKWDEFQQHEESMEKMQEFHTRQQMQASMSPPPSASSQWMQYQQLMQFDPNRNPQEANVLPAEAWYPADTEKGKTQQQQPQQQNVSMPGPGITSFSEPQITSTPNQPRYRVAVPRPPSPQINFSASPSIYSHVPDNAMSHSSVGQTRPPSPPHFPTMHRPDLARRPLHSYHASPKRHHQEIPAPASLRSRMMSALGFNPYSTVPPGLKNNGHNICFMNSVLQCLAHSPGFLGCLNHDRENSQCNNDQAALIASMVELLQGLSAKPGTSEVSVLDARGVRVAASALPGTMVLHPNSGAQQQQQDSAELLMWLFGVLHSAMNRSNRNAPNHNGSANTQQPCMGANMQRQQGAPRYTSLTLNMLKFIYGDLNPQRISELKAACRKEIELASGVDNDSYGEPLQRLADLEWLTYKDCNNSSVDDLFTGQSVEAQQCLACNRISVSIQTFNILPLPLVEPRNFNGLIYLEDCFGKFGTVEELYGPNGLHCQCSNKVMGNQVGGGPRDPVSTPTSTHPANPAVQASPIMPNGGSHLGLSARHRKRLLGPEPQWQNSPGMMAASAVSPIAKTTVEVMNDSGFQDHPFRTSTPIQGIGGKLTDGQRRSLLRQLPECLVVQLLRFGYSEAGVHKDQRPISIPLTQLDLTQLIVDNVMRREDLTALHATFTYQLYAFCLHLGGDTTSYGHYISYARASDGAWYRFDDERVTAVNINYELNTKQVRENAYLLFFRKNPIS